MNRWLQNFHLLWSYFLSCSRKNFKLLFCAEIALAVGVQIYIFHPMRMTDAILPGSPPWGNIKGHTNHFSPSSHFPTGQQQRTSQPIWQSTFSLNASLLASSRTDHLFFSHNSSCPLSIMKNAHPIYGPLVSGKSFFHHSSFLLNQWILGETNWIFSTRFNFSILIPVLTTASQLLLLTPAF